MTINCINIYIANGFPTLFTMTRILLWARTLQAENDYLNDINTKCYQKHQCNYSWTKQWKPFCALEYTFYTYSIFYTHTYRKDICAINKPIASVYSQFQTELYILFNFHFQLNRSCQIIVVIISYIGAFPLLNFVSFCFVCIASRMAVHCLHKIVRISNSIYDIPHTTHTLLVYTIHRTAYIHNYNISFSIFAAFKQNIQ